MSTTPSTPELPAYRIGARRRSGPEDRSAVVLPGPPAEPVGQTVARLGQAGCGSVIWCAVGRSGTAGMLERESESPELRVLTLDQDPGAATWLAIAVSESPGREVLVVSADRVLLRAPEDRTSREVPLILPRRLDALGNAGADAVVPVPLPNHRLEFRPITQRGRNRPAIAGMDFCGLYDVQSFAASEGFPRGMRSPWWQRIAFGLRLALQGRPPRVSDDFAVRVPDDEAPERAERDEDYFQVHLRFLAPAMGPEGIELTPSEIVRSALRSGRLLWSLRLGAETRKWVRAHRQEFQLDAASLAELWEV